MGEGCLRSGTYKQTAKCNTDLAVKLLIRGLLVDLGWGDGKRCTDQYIQVIILTISHAQGEDDAISGQSR